MSDDGQYPIGPQDFATTRWSLVADAGRPESPESAGALAALCDAYWFPLYAFVRRCGHGPDDARDLTQEFLTVVLEKGYLRDADSRRGRFRTFLLACLKHFLSKERDRARALKRGGGRRPHALDFGEGERLYALEPAHGQTAERLYERRWALAVLDRALDRLREDAVRAGTADTLRRIEAYLLDGDHSRSYREAAAELGTTEGAVKVAVHRLRRRFRDLLLGEIAATVQSPGEVEDEVRHLLVALRPDRPFSL
jgi:RNA polymerase sigma-70 factor (ECF subfamily)